MNTLRDSVRRFTDRRQWRARAYLLLGLPLGALWFGLVAVLYLSGLAAQFLLVGVLFLIGAQLLLRPIGRVERYLVNRLLGEHVPAPDPLRPHRSAGTRWAGWSNVARRCAAAFRDGHSWRVLAWTLLRFVGGPIGFVLVVVEVLLPVVLVAAPFAVAVAGLTGRVPAHLRWVYVLLLGPVALPLLVGVQASIGRLTGMFRDAAGRLLGPGPRELEAAALARARVAEEQVRIDQELHDSIGHLLSMIVVQAGAGAHTFDADPAFARSALRTIEERGRAALGELDRIITSIRDGDPGQAPVSSSLPSSPAPRSGVQAPLRGEEDLPGLISGAVEAGMEVSSRLRARGMPPAVGRGAYRIVQEALTNAARHAPGSRVAVEVVADAGVVAVSVVNAAPGPSGSRHHTPAGPGLGRSGGGRGLVSIRDRAGLLGGVATTGATDDGGFAVRVVLPLTAALPPGAGHRCSLTRRCSCLGCRIRRSVLG